MRKKVIWVDGGIGRVICALPAIDKLAEKEKVIVITSWKEIFANKNNIERVYKPDSEYLWEDVILNNDLIHTEPYWNSSYYRDKCHLIQAFEKELLGTYNEEISKPNIVLNDVEDNFGKQVIKSLKKEHNKKIIVIQPFGSTGNWTEDGKIMDESNRSLSWEFTKRIIEECKEDVLFLYFGAIPLDHYGITFNRNICIPGSRCTKDTDITEKKPIFGIPQDLGLRGIISIIKHCDGFIGCDSVGQHLAYIFDKPSVIFIGGTDPSNITYPGQTILKKEGYPKEYNPYRLPYNSHMIVANQGAMDFTEEEQESFIKTIKEKIM